MRDTAVVVGASRGIGAAVARHITGRFGRVLSVSRTAAPSGEWLPVDVSTRAGVDSIADAVASDPVEALLYMGGGWERNAFTDAYRFETCADDDLQRVLNINLLAPIRCVQALLPALRRGKNPKVVFMGALSGLDNFPSKEVANSASKFGLRGAIHSLRENLREDRIGVTVINPGSIATPEVLDDVAKGFLDAASVIPMTDLLAVVDLVLGLSRSTAIKEIHLPAMLARGA